MEVAVGVDRLDLIALAESEADLRLFAGMQFLTLITLLGLERYLWNRPCFGCQASAPSRLGGKGQCFTCLICGQKRNLWLEQGKWFVEAYCSVPESRAS